MRGTPPASQTVVAGYSEPDSISLGELDGLMCRHSTPVSRSLWEDRVQNKVPCHATVGGTRGDPAPSRAGLTNGAGGGHGISPRTGCLSTDMGNQDGGVACRVSIHGEVNAYGGPGISQCPLHMPRNRSLRPPSSLGWMKCQNFYMSCLGL